MYVILMTFEVEVKFSVSSLDKLEDLLIEKGSILVDIVSQRDHYFNHPSRDFKETDEAVRIREDGDLCFLTYKGPKLDSKSKSRVEEEVEVTNFDKTKNILINLGFRKVLAVIKERRVYQLQGFFICLDNVESLGTFVEIEKEVENENDMIKTRDEIFALANELALNPQKTNIRTSYLELLLEKKNG